MTDPITSVKLFSALPRATGAVLDMMHRGVITTPFISVTADPVKLVLDGPLAAKTCSKKIL